MTCTAQPVSWLRLEQYALSMLADSEREVVDLHIAKCATCRHCLQQVTRDVVALPPLALLPLALLPLIVSSSKVSSVVPIDSRATETPAAAKRRKSPVKPWYYSLWSPLVAGPAIAIAAGLLLWFKLSPSKTAAVSTQELPSSRGVSVASIKGGGDVTLTLVRERAGIVAQDVADFNAGDRWKALMSCTPQTTPNGAARMWADVVVFEHQIDGTFVASFPTTPSELACGNNVVVPGAFAITGTAINTVCVALALHQAPQRTLLVAPGSSTANADVSMACSEVSPGKP
jgi:hypothetical protein